MADHTERKGEDAITHVTLENPSKSLAFFVRLKVDQGKGGEEILPVIWQDNYISLLPGEKREVSATYGRRTWERPSQQWKSAGGTWRIEWQDVILNGLQAVKEPALSLRRDLARIGTIAGACRVLASRQILRD